MHEHSLFTVQIIPVINHLKCFVREHKKFIAPLFPCTIDISGRICFLLLNKNKINKKTPGKVKGWMESSGFTFYMLVLTYQEKWSGFAGKLCQSKIFWFLRSSSLFCAIIPDVFL